MNRSSLTIWTTGAAAGVGLMYFLDPTRGRRRRAEVMQQTTHFRKQWGRELERSARDLYNRAHRLKPQSGSGQPTDEVLTARVKSRLGRVVSHPRALQVVASHGHVILSGPVLQGEARTAIRAASRVPGVLDVENHLEPHSTRDQIPALQSGPSHRKAIRQASPATRLFCGALGSGLLLWSVGGGRRMRRWAKLFGASAMSRSLDRARRNIVESDNALPQNEFGRGAAQGL